MYCYPNKKSAMRALRGVLASIPHDHLTYTVCADSGAMEFVCGPPLSAVRYQLRKARPFDYRQFTLTPLENGDVEIKSRLGLVGHKVPKNVTADVGDISDLLGESIT